MIKLSDYVIKRVAQEVRHIFLLPGGGCMHLIDSVGRCKDIEYVCNLHEQACAIAADAYGQYTNNLGVALVTTGPGGTNTVTGVAASWLESTPCLFISGQVKRADLAENKGVRQMGFQEINIVRIVESITKYAVMITDPNSIKYHLEKALYLAKHGRPGPVWIDIPLDVQATQIDESQLKGFDPDETDQSFDAALLARQVNSAIELLNRAERPALLVGNGVRLSRALEDFMELAELLQVPVLTTWKAMDFFPEDHPLYVGRPGAVGQRGANFTQQNSDWFLSLGARLDFGQIGFNHRNFARSAKKIMVDIDPAEIKKLDMNVDVPVCADAKSFIREFIRQKSSIVGKDRSAWWTRCRKWKSKYPLVLPEYWSFQDGVSVYVLLDVLADAITGDDLLVPGSSGACSELPMQSFRVKHGMRVFNCNGLGPMGFAVPAGIGGCLASGRKRTICLDGDGGFSMNIQELETVRRLNLPIKFFVLNNGGYGSIQATQRAYFEGRYVASNAASGLTLPDTCRVASAYGLATAEIRDHSSIKEQVRQVLEQKGPVVCEVFVSPQHTTAPRVVSMQKQDGTMVSKPLEDLWPFLEREEFIGNMLIPPLNEDHS
ncbi:MAG: thiamine pyrophosphate-binding protein [Kiritimatiellaeota bacterium]|nr:thiamine pyrophosphate-binding protein [Kiritimatiellota bacterium]